MSRGFLSGGFCPRTQKPRLESTTLSPENFMKKLMSGLLTYWFKNIDVPPFILSSKRQTGFKMECVFVLQLS